MENSIKGRRILHCVFAASSVADPYHFDMDPDPNPDPGCEKICYESGSRVNFDTDPNPGKNYTDPDPAQKAYVPGKSSKSA